MSGDHGALPRSQCRVEHRVQVARQVVEAVAVASRDLAAAVAAVVERDHPVVCGQIGDLVEPDAQRTRDAVAQYDRVAVFGAENFGVDPGAVLGPYHDRAADGQVSNPVPGSANATALHLLCHDRSDRCGSVAAPAKLTRFLSAKTAYLSKYPATKI